MFQSLVSLVEIDIALLMAPMTHKPLNLNFLFNLYHPIEYLSGYHMNFFLSSHLHFKSGHLGFDGFMVIFGRSVAGFVEIWVPQSGIQLIVGSVEKASVNHATKLYLQKHRYFLTTLKHLLYKKANYF